MTFKTSETEVFLEVFSGSKDKIRNFPGCRYLALLKHQNDPRIFFTHSLWENEEALNSYRHSDLFKTTWAATKKLFDEAPEAWSLDAVQELP